MSATFQEVVGAQSDIVDRVIIQADEPTETPDPSEELVYWYPTESGLSYAGANSLMSAPADNTLSAYSKEHGVLVYVDDDESEIVAVDVDTDEVLWRDSEYDSESYTDGEYVYLYGRYSLRVVDILDGSLHFETSSDAIDYMRGLENGIVLTESGSAARAFDTSTGDQLWETTDLSMDGLDCFNSNDEYVVVSGGHDSGDEYIWVLDRDTGAEIDNRDIGTITTYGNLYIADGKVVYQNDADVIARNPENMHNQVWSHGTSSSTIRPGGVVSESTLYQPTDGGIVAVDLARGTSLWESSSTVEGSLDFHDGVLYHGEDDAVVLRDAETGDKLSEFALSDDPESTHAAPGEGFVTHTWSSPPINMAIGGGESHLGEPLVSSGEEWVEVGE